MVSYKSIFPVGKRCLQDNCEWDTVKNFLPTRASLPGDHVLALHLYRCNFTNHRLCQFHAKGARVATDNKELKSYHRRLAHRQEVDNYTCISWTFVTGNGCLWSWLVRVPVQHLVSCVLAWPLITGCSRERKSVKALMAKISHITSTGLACSENVK